MLVNKFNSHQEAAAAAGETLNSLLISNKDTPVLLMLSGGSSFSVLEYAGDEGLTENLTISMLDKRFNQDPDVNNFLQLQKLEFYERALKKHVNFTGTLPRPGELMDDIKIRFELALKNWKNANPKGKIFATFGIGADGHTAGIFPYPDNPAFFNEAFENQHWVMAYFAKGKHKHEQRITTTFTFFKLIDEAIVFICGDDKKIAFEKFIKGNGQPHELPALGIHQTKHQQIFTDIISN